MRISSLPLNVFNRLASLLASVVAPSVKSLTLLVAPLMLVNCAYLHRSVGEWCKSRAYINGNLSDFISTRFASNAPVRIGIIPFTVPANLATQKPSEPGAEDQLAWHLHRELLAREAAPIIEVLPRPDWPGKRDEFFTGNHGAIEAGRAAGYDIVIVGFVDPIQSLSELSAQLKVIDTAGGVTIWYGSVAASTIRPEIHESESFLGLYRKTPSLQYTAPLLQEVAKCAAAQIFPAE